MDLLLFLTIVIFAAAAIFFGLGVHIGWGCGRTEAWAEALAAVARDENERSHLGLIVPAPETCDLFDWADSGEGEA